MRSAPAWSLLIVATLVGCNNPPSSPSSNNIPEANNSVGIPDSNSSASSNNSETTANNQAGTTSGTNNPSRIHQLNTLSKITLKTPGGDLHLWVMDDEEKRREGMMFLENREVKDNEGMIFVFDKVQELKGNYAFWMHNTILPLDIDYISKDKKVINVGKGKPFSDDPVKPEGDYLYVIEVKQGLSSKFGLTAGSKVNIPTNLVGKP